MSDETRERALLLADMAIARAELYEELLGLSEEALTTGTLGNGWTIKGLLAHVADWDSFFAERLKLVSAGRGGEIVGVEADDRNALVSAERRDWPLARVTAELDRSREQFLTELSLFTDAQMNAPIKVAWGEVTVLGWAEWRAKHDREHLADLTGWRKAQHEADSAGPRELLAHALRASRLELLRLGALVPATERDTAQICGDWTWKDLCGHVADWEALSLAAARRLVNPAAPLLDYNGDLEAFNARHSAVRRDQPWDFVWAECQAVHFDLLAFLDGLAQADLARATSTRWSSHDSPYQWLSASFAHDREHSISLAAYLGVPRLMP